VSVKEIKIAAIQMDANPAPTPERLQRAGRLVAQAASVGAQLVTLPEIFNTGYAYSDDNYHRAEQLDGLTASWMRETAARLGIHLAGTLMLLDKDEVYNALLLFGPDGSCWRYDKQFPWGWERAYFRGGQHTCVAHTMLGDIGMLVCWDSAHLELWRRYAGQVNLMLICSCPPDVSNPCYHLPDGRQVSFDDLGPLMRRLKGSASKVFQEMLTQQTAWLGVPAVSTVGCGSITTAIPNPRGSLLALAASAPRFLKYLPQAGQLRMSCNFVPGCKILDERGRTLAERSQEEGEGFTLAQVHIPQAKPAPQAPQPPAPIPCLTYWISDSILPRQSLPVYRRGLRRALGSRMAPARTSTRQWGALLGICLVAWFFLGRLSKRRK
jgi:hypothetical protein